MNLGLGQQFCSKKLQWELEREIRKQDKGSFQKIKKIHIWLLLWDHLVLSASELIVGGIIVRRGYNEE